MENVLQKFVCEFARGIKIADDNCPPHKTYGKYSKGIGPYHEPETVKKVLSEFPEKWKNKYELEVRYPKDSKSCDVQIKSGEQNLYIEIKRSRQFRANGQEEPANISHILSPYPDHRSALTDIQKLKDSKFEGEKAIVVFGYNYEKYQMSDLIVCFEKLAGSTLKRPGYCEKFEFDNTVDKTHKRGQVHGWMLS